MAKMPLPTAPGPTALLERFATAFEGPDEHLGERVVRAYLQAWEACLRSRSR